MISSTFPRPVISLFLVTIGGRARARKSLSTGWRPRRPRPSISASAPLLPVLLPPASPRCRRPRHHSSGRNRGRTWKEREGGAKKLFFFVPLTSSTSLNLARKKREREDLKLYNFEKKEEEEEEGERVEGKKFLKTSLWCPQRPALHRERQPLCKFGKRRKRKRGKPPLSFARFSFPSPSPTER